MGRICPTAMSHHTGTTPDGMGMDRHRERQNMREAARFDPEGTHRLRVFRPHPHSDRTITETWGHGSAEELEAKAERKREEHPNYRFEVQEKKK
jgi:hypothetical protein